MTRRPTICLLLTLMPLTACATRPRSHLDDAVYPGTLQRPSALPVEAVWQQHVTARWSEPGEDRAQPDESGQDGAVEQGAAHGEDFQERGFDAAVQRQGNTLTVLGLSPMGSVGFAIVQTDDGIEVTTNVPESLPIPARFILLDVQRTFFPWFGDGGAAGAGFSGDRIARIAGEEIDESWQDGRLQQRTFRRVDGQPEGTISISYTWDRPDWAVPTRAVLDNGWFGYRLTIDTHAETRLPPAGAGTGTGGTASTDSSAAPR